MIRRALTAVLPEVAPLLLLLAIVTTFHWTPLTDPVTFQAVPADDDVLTLTRPRNLNDFQDVQRNGGLAAWNERIGLGVSAAETGSQSHLYLPRTLAMRVAPTAGAAADLLTWAHGLLAALGALLLARLYGLGRWSAVLAGVLYALAHFVIRWAPFPTYEVFAATLPFVVFGVELIWRRQPAAGIAALALGLGIGGVGGGIQAAQLDVQVAGLVAAFRLITAGGAWRARVRPSLQTAGGMLLGLVVAAPGWLPFALEQRGTTRVESPFEEIGGATWGGTAASIFDPVAAMERYNGDLYLALAAPLLLVVGVLVSLRTRKLAVLPLVVGVGLAIAFKTVLLEVVIAVVPGWSVVSNTERIAGWVLPLPLALLAAVGADRLTRIESHHLAFAAAVGAIAASVGWWQLRMGDVGLASGRVWLIAAGALAVVGAIWWRTSGARARAALVAAFPIALAVLSLAGAQRERELGWGPVLDEPEARFTEWLPLVSGFNDVEGRWMSYCQELNAGAYIYRPDIFLEAPGRWLDIYTSFVDERYSAFWRALTGSDRYRVPLGGQWYQHTPQDPVPDPGFVNAAGVTRVLGSRTCAPDLPALGWGELSRNDHFVVYQNHGAYPLAYLSRRWREVSGGTSAEIAALDAEPDEFGKHADVISGGGGWPVAPGGDPQRLAHRRNGPSEVVVELGRTIDEPAAVVLLDRYADGWHAYSDGERRDIRRVNGVFRAALAEPGDRVIVFRYEPWTGGILAWISGLSAAGVAIAPFALRRRRAADSLPRV